VDFESDGIEAGEVDRDATRDWVDHSDLVEYYTSHRNREAALYPSERRFVPWLAIRAQSVLDVGCGAGGLSAVWRSYRRTIRYTGVDISEPLVKAARRAHPEHEFIRADCAAGLPLEDRFADVAVALGWLHWEERYAGALTELWRVARRYAFFDLRLIDAAGPDTTGTQRLALTGEWDGHTTVPYICASWPRVAELLLELRPSRLLAHGYWGKPAGTVIGVDREVCFATFVLERSDSGEAVRPEVALDLPLPWPEQLAGAVRLSGAASLNDLESDEEEGIP
jgi:SAM-dependent methyltransferase